MKKYIRSIAACLMAVMMLCLCLSSCVGGGNEGPASLEEELANGAKLSILIPGHNSKSTNAEFWQNPVVKQFAEDYPELNVEWVTAGWDAWETKLLATISANDPVDVLNDGVNNNPKFAIKGITQPLNDYVNLENPNLHLNTMNSVFCYGGDYYVAVSETNVAAVYYNKYLFDNAGLTTPTELYENGNWNWTTFVDAAKKLTSEKDNRAGFACNYPYILFGANGTSVLKLDEEFKYSLNIESEPMKHALELIQDGWYTSKWQHWEGDPWSAFYNGSAAMLCDFQWVEKNIIDAATYGLVDFEYGVVPVPFGPDNSEGLSPIHAAGWAIVAGSDCPHAAGILIDRLVDGHAAYQAETNKGLPEANVALYKQLAQKGYCTNSYDSAVGGAFELFGALTEGKSISQAIAELKPVYQTKVDDANEKN